MTIFYQISLESCIAVLLIVILQYNIKVQWELPNQKYSQKSKIT